MTPRKYAHGAGVCVLAALLIFSGCIFGPEDKDDTPKPPQPDFRALTDKENVVHNLVECYKWADIEHYIELLHDDYIWYNQAEDVTHGLAEYYTRAEDIEMTRNMFSAKLGTHPDPTKKIERLSITIQYVEWQQVYEMGGEPCVDCWETTREYFLQIIMDNGNLTLMANDLIRFTVVPVESGGETLYKLYRADDIPRPL